MRIRWATLAEADLDALVLYIAQDSVDAALRVQERILEAVEGLTSLADRGRPGRVSGTRELVIAATSYVAVYAVTEDTVSILRVLHGVQEWPRGDVAS